MRRLLFERMVEEILGELPPEFGEKIENVEFVIEAEPDASIRAALGSDSRTCVLGLYQGVPLPQRSPAQYAGALPDRITIYWKNVEALSRTPAKRKEVLRQTLLHEIAHYFGISDERLRELGVY